MKKLSIIIVNYKTPELLKLCINSIKEKCSLDYEIVVVDSASEEDTQILMREEFPDIKFLPLNENKGYAYGVNIGIKNSEGEYIIVMNPDIIFLNNAADIMIDYFEKNQNIGIIGPRLTGFDGQVQYSCYRFYTPLTILYRRTFLGKISFGKKQIDKIMMQDADHEKIIEADWLLGAILLTKRELINKIGYMDERFFLYFEDMDWCRRFWEAGYKAIYLPEAQMAHYHRRLSADKKGIFSIFFNKVTRIHIASALKYFIKYNFKSYPKERTN